MPAVTIHKLADGLLADLRAAYRLDSPSGLGAGPLRAVCLSYGRAAAEASLPLEDAMAGAVDVLQTALDRLDIANGTVTLAAGVALAAVAEAWYAERASCPDPHADLANAPLHWLEGLHRINRSSTANLDLPARLETSVRVVADTIGADACALALYDQGTGLLVLRAAVGLNPSSIGVVTGRPGMGITGLAAAEGRVIAAVDARSHPAYVSYPGTGEDLYTSQVSLPLLIRQGDEPGRLVGVLNILSMQRREFSRDEIAFLETMAGELAISIENARLYSQTDARLQRKIVELGTLQRVSHTIASNLDLDAVLRAIAEQAVQLINVESAAIFRLPNGRRGADGPTIEYRVGRSREVVDEPTRDAAITGVLHSGEARAVDLEYTDGSGRLFCLPLRSARETLGALCLRMGQGAELTDDQLALLQAFSDSATLAIEHATLYQEARQGYETASALLQEMHHRVRNNLQTVAALLSVQLRANEEAQWAGALREAISRVQAIAAIHDLLSDESRLGGTTVDIIARHVANEAHRTLIPPGLTVKFDIPASGVRLPSRQSTVLALLINELVANAVRHGFKGRERGTIRIVASQTRGMAMVAVENDGISPPAQPDPERTSGLGMRIVHRLVTSDLSGSYTLEPLAEGAVATLTFPIEDGGDQE
jgi:two-component sensor histidine kinase/putative methionine-R-sulfoxide reductase with GAF domain